MTAFPQNQTHNCCGNFSESNLITFHSVVWLIPSTTVAEITCSCSSTATFFCKVAARAALFLRNPSGVERAQDNGLRGWEEYPHNYVAYVFVISPWCIQTKICLLSRWLPSHFISFSCSCTSLNDFNLLVFIQSWNFFAGWSVSSLLPLKVVYHFSSISCAISCSILVWG